MDNLTLERLETLFFEQGYGKIPSNLPEFNFYCHRETQGINVLYVIDYRQGLYISKDQYAHLKEKIFRFFQDKGEQEIHVMTLVLCTNTEKAKKLCENDSLCWVIDAQAYRLLIHETQIADFYGWKDLLEEYLFSLTRERCETAEPVGTAKEERLHALSWVNVILVAINVIVFLICTFTGDLLYNIGAISITEFFQKHEYYRIVTSLFLHWDINHLVSNMIVLYYLGEVVEEHYGLVRYGILYFTAGIGGNILSMVYEFCSKTVMFSAGASGAIFGVIGALFLLVIIHKGHLNQISIGRLMFMLAYSLYSGFVGGNINNAAHIGGFLSGTAVAFIYLFCNWLKTEKTVQSV